MEKSNVVDTHYRILYSSFLNSKTLDVHVSAWQDPKNMVERKKLETTKSIVHPCTVMNLYYNITHTHEQDIHAPGFPRI